MKTVYLLRHAKSAAAVIGVEDHDRPLNERGRADAPLMGTYMADKGHTPDNILCSSATRARETLEALAPKTTPGARTEILDKLYMASAGGILALLQDLPSDVSAPLVIAHNPGMGELAGMLAAIGDGLALARMAGKFSTAALAVIAFDLQAWKDVSPGAGELVDFATPKLL